MIQPLTATAHLRAARRFRCRVSAARAAIADAGNFVAIGSAATAVVVGDHVHGAGSVGDGADLVDPRRQAQRSA